MWHEARKQERMIRGLIVDYRRRAERRKDFYEKIKAEPTQFLQLHGRPCKIHLDPAIAAAGESAAIMMPWQGDSNNMIDRFDVRAHLDFIPDVKYPDVPPEELSPEERQCNYERYRILAQNNFLGISEDKFLRQLAIEEQYGVTIEEKEMQKEKLLEKKGTGAAIGYNYSDPGAQPSGSNGPDVQKIEQKDSDDDSDLEIIDVDLSIDVNKMEASQAHSLNAVGPSWGMAGCDLFSFLTGDADDAEQQKQLLREEKEKAMFSGRKSRRERRAHRDKKLAARVVSPPSYAAPRARSASASPPRAARSPSPPPPPASIQFITSFGPEDDDKPPAKPLYAEKLKQNLKKESLYSDVARKPKSRSPARPMGPMGPFGPPPEPPRSRSRSRSRSKSRSTSRSRPASRSRSRSFRKSRSRSRSRSSSHSRSCSPQRRNYRRRSRSPQNHGYSKRNRSRSMSFESSRARPGPARYYGRRAEDKSSSELSLDSASSDSADDIKNKSAVANKSNSNQNQIRSGTSSKGSSRDAISLKEKLKRKMQAQLSRQLRADQRAEALRLERESRRQARRDQEMRDLAIKLRRKQREMRHQRNRRSSEEDSDRSQSRSSSGCSQNGDRKKDKSRSASPPPPEKRIPVWESDPEFATVPFRPKPPEGDSSSYQRRRFAMFDNENYSDRHPREQTHEPRPHEPRPYEPRPYEPRPYEQRPYEARAHEPRAYEQRGDSGRGFPRRRPFRGGYRGQGYRHGPDPPDRFSYGDGPSGYRAEERADADAPRNKVKLVDY